MLLNVLFALIAAVFYLMWGIVASKGILRCGWFKDASDDALGLMVFLWPIFLAIFVLGTVLAFFGRLLRDKRVSDA